MDEWVERPLSTKHGLGAHSCANLGQQGKVYGFVEGEGANGGGERRAIEDTEVLLRRQRDGVDLVRLKRNIGRNNLARAELGRTVEDADRGVPDECASDVRQRGKI